MLRDNWPVIDWREPIGLQERLEGRSSHNGEISVMSRSRFQGTEVTIVTGAFLNLQLNLLMLLSTEMLVDPFFFFIFSSDNSPVLKETNYILIMKVK